MSINNHASPAEKVRLTENKIGFIQQNRNKLLFVLFAAFLGIGGIAANTIKVPMNGPGSHQIPLVQKIKYGLSDLMNGKSDTDIKNSIENPNHQKKYNKNKDETPSPPHYDDSDFIAS